MSGNFVNVFFSKHISAWSPGNSEANIIHKRKLSTLLSLELESLLIKTSSNEGLIERQHTTHTRIPGKTKDSHSIIDTRTKYIWRQLMNSQIPGYVGNKNTHKTHDKCCRGYLYSNTINEKGLKIKYKKSLKRRSNVFFLVAMAT